MFDSILQNDNTKVNSQNKNSGNKKTLKRSNFKIHIQNSWNKTVHLNKGSKLGEIYEIEDIKIPNTANEENKTNQIMSQSVNLLQASPEVLDLRKKELCPADFELTHLNENERSHILQLLLKNYNAFSKSLKSLGHTELSLNLSSRVIFQSKHFHFQSLFPYKKLLLNKLTSFLKQV